MNQVTNFIIIALVLIVLAIIVVVALMKRAKNDPESLRNTILEHINVPDGADEFYDIIEHFVDKRDIVSRDARPKIPDSNDYQEELAAMEEQSRKAQEKLEKQDLEEIDLW